MNKLIAISICLLLAGCVNLYIRCPGTNTKIMQTYQSTHVASGLSYVVMFPQVMFPSKNTAFIPENLISIPVGCLGFVDTACEAVIDTMMLPFDYEISNNRAKHDKQ